MTPPLDVRTLCFASSAAVLSLALVMTYVWSRRRTYAGYGQWTLSAWCAFLGTCLLGARGVLPNLLTVVGANLALYSASALVASGLTVFTGGQAKGLWYAALVGAATALVAGFLYLHPSLRGRLIVYSLTTGGLCFRAAHLARRRLPAVLADTNALVYVTLLVLGTAYGLRGLLSILMPPASENFLAPSASQTMALLLFLGGQACIYAGLTVANGQRVEQDLKAAVEECKVLRDIIPICATCKKVRDDQGAWNQVEAYIRQHLEVEFTHGICPDCARAFKQKDAAGA